MATRKYTGAFSLPNGITLNALAPWDDRSVQKDYAALKKTETWKVGSVDCVYTGMLVALENGDLYVYTGKTNSTEYTQDAKWKKIGSDIDPSTFTNYFKYKGTVDVLKNPKTVYHIKNDDGINFIVELNKEFKVNKIDNIVHTCPTSIDSKLYLKLVYNDVRDEYHLVVTQATDSSIVGWYLCSFDDLTGDVQGDAFDSEAKDLSEYASVAAETQTSLADEAKANGASVGDVWNIVNEFELDGKWYAAGTNIVFKANHTKGISVATWENKIDPISGENISLGYLQSNYYTKTDVDSLVGDGLSDNDERKLAFFNVDGWNYSTDLLTLKNGQSDSTISTLYSLVRGFNENGKMNFLVADGYKVKVETTEVAVNFTKFCFTVKGKHYRATISDNEGVHTLAWEYYDEENVPEGLTLEDMYNAQVAFALVANQNQTSVAQALTEVGKYNERITNVENRLKWYDLDEN